MKKQISLHFPWLRDSSLQRQLTFFIVLFLVPLHILLLGITAASTLIMYQHTRTTYQNMIDFFMDEIDTSLDFISRFLVNTAAENSTFQSIAYDYSDVDLNMESIRLYRYLQHNVVLYPDLQYLFVHKTRTEPLIVLAPNPTYYAFSLSNFEMRNYLIKYLAANTDGAREWQLLTIEGQQYLLCMLKFNDTQLGALVPISALLEKLEKYQIENGQFTVTAYVPQDGAPRLFARLTLHELRIYAHSSTGDFSIELRSSAPFDSNAPFVFYLLCTVLSLALLAIIPLSRRYMCQHFSKPIDIVLSHMRRAQTGDASVRLPNDIGSCEMNILAQAFNHMMDDIQQLNDRVLDEQKQRSQVYLQCMQLQLSPHFFLNTLNTIYLLSYNDEHKKLQDITLNMIEYFRNVFNSSSPTISLGNELLQCRRYISIYQIRKDQTIDFLTDVPESVMEYPVPPLSILTFVENSLKHAVQNGVRLQISVSIRCVALPEGGIGLQFRLADNGQGFPGPILEHLNAMHPPMEVTGSHIGLPNLQNRLFYCYGTRTSIWYANAENGGAQVTVIIPITF